MKKLTNCFWNKLSILIIFFCSVSCSKDAFEVDDKESYTIGFRFQPLSNSIRPLSKSMTADAAQRSLNKIATIDQQPNGSVRIQQGYLYYWSFNAESLRADQYNSPDHSMTYNGGSVPASFVAGWKYDTYAAGKALSLKGLEELIIKMPLLNVVEVQSFSLDVGSSDTGPKSFDIFYSQDGEEYHLLAEDNQFFNTKTAYSKSSFDFYFDDVELDLLKDLYVKIEPKEGERGDGAAYNEKTGTFRVDNIRLLGVGNIVSDRSVQKFHYHVFDAVTRSLIIEGAEVYEEDNMDDFVLQLPAGSYMASFIVNQSNEELLSSERADADDFFVSNKFSNSEASIFGVVYNFEVLDEQQYTITLDRYYSQVKFEFTNTEDLSDVEKIVITEVHEPNFFAAFNTKMKNPILDQSEIVIYPDFSKESKEIVFNQFIGNAIGSVPLVYNLILYDKEGKFLNSFNVSAAVGNNMQLVFRGALPLDKRNNSSFAVMLNKKWHEEIVVDF